MMNGFEDIPILENEEMWASRVIDEQPTKVINTASGKKIEVYDNLISFSTLSKHYRFALDSSFAPRGGDNAVPEQAGASNFVSYFNIDDLNDFNLYADNAKFIGDRFKNNNIKGIYLNCSTFAEKHYPHCDGAFSDITTVLYYVCPTWDISWGGCTIFLDEHLKDVEYCSLYTPGRIVVFDGDIPHYMMPPTILSKAYRFTLAVQYFN